MTNQMQGKQDVYTRVTQRIASQLEEGVRPWARPWRNTSGAGVSTGRPQRHNGEPYRGINVLLLWDAAQSQGFSAQTWMTYQQALSYRAHVRKGEHGSLVVYADRYTKTDVDRQGEEVEREVAFLKSYAVFNVEQIDDLPERFRTSAPMPSEERERPALLEGAEAFFNSTGARFRHGGDRAFYAPGPDVIQLPHATAFVDPESYAATKAHELIHWSGHETRKAREFGRRFGDDAYAFEELVAELGAAFLCADLAITAEPRADHAAYLAHWLRVLRNDKRAIFAAASHAQAAADYLHELQTCASVREAA